MQIIVIIGIVFLVCYLLIKSPKIIISTFKLIASAAMLFIRQFPEQVAKQSKAQSLDKNNAQK